MPTRTLVALGIGVDVGVGLDEEIGLELGVGVDVAIAVAVGLDVSVKVGVGCEVAVGGGVEAERVLVDELFTTKIEIPILRTITTANAIPTTLTFNLASASCSIYFLVLLNLFSAPALIVGKPIRFAL